MELEKGEEGEGEEIGGEAVDGGDAEQRLQGNQQPEKLADAFRREFRAGPGFVAGQLRDDGDVESEHDRADPGIRSRRQAVGRGGGAEEEIAGATGAHEQRADERAPLEADVVEDDAQDKRNRDGQGIEEGGEKSGDPEKNQRDGGGGFARDFVGGQRPVRAIPEILGVIEEIVENESGAVEQNAGRNRQQELAPIPRRRRGGEEEAGEDVAGNGQQVGQAQDPEPGVAVRQAGKEILHQVIGLDGFLPDHGKQLFAGRRPVSAGRWRDQCRAGPAGV